VLFSWDGQTLLPALAILVFLPLGQLRHLVFEKALQQLFFRNARRLARPRVIHHWPPADHQLPGAARDDDDVRKLAFRCLSENSHKKISLQRTSESRESVLPFAPCDSASRARWPALRVRHDRDRR